MTREKTHLTMNGKTCEYIKSSEITKGKEMHSIVLGGDEVLSSVQAHLEEKQKKKK